MPRALLVTVAAAVLVLATAAPALGTDVQGDDAGDRYVGTGGLVLPGSFGHETRTRVAHCLDCDWRLAVPCAQAPPAPGTLMPGQSPVATCTSVVRGCPHGQLLRTWFASGGGPWTDLGVACYGTGAPVTILDLATRAGAAFAADLPPVRVRTEPRSGVLAQLPVAISSGQPEGDFVAAYRLLGQDVRVRATPHWQWTFGDGASLATDQPGGSYPDLTVAHPYRRAGRFPITVTVTWSARFSLAGLGEFDVADPVRQEGATVVEVGQGRAVLAVR